MLVRRVREALQAIHLQCIGTSATLAGPGSLEQQRVEVANVASILFGDRVSAESVIGETLRRATNENLITDEVFIGKLRSSIQNPNLPGTYDEFTEYPLASWVESRLGLRSDNETGRLVRALPKSLTGNEGAGNELSRLTGLPYESCVQALQSTLLSGYSVVNPQTSRPAFAFRLHQFISRGDTVYASLEAEDDRHITVYGQKFVPGEREKLVFPLAFCRECGQEYYVVRQIMDQECRSARFCHASLTKTRSLMVVNQSSFILAKIIPGLMIIMSL